MIVPNVRASFDRSDAAFVVWLLTRGNERDRLREEDRMREEGFDALLDDPRTFNVLLAGKEFSSATPGLVFYLLVRHALLESGVQDRILADYLSTLLVAFGGRRRAFRIDGDDDAEFHYLADILTAAEAADEHRAFMLRAHLGEYALWLSGLFPDHISARVQRRGAPDIRYYEQLGAAGYRQAADFRLARQHGLDRVYRDCAETFRTLRVALNRVADRHMFPASGDRIERLLRQVMDDFADKETRAGEH